MFKRLPTTEQIGTMYLYDKKRKKALIRDPYAHHYYDPGEGDQPDGTSVSDLTLYPSQHASTGYYQFRYEHRPLVRGRRARQKTLAAARALGRNKSCAPTKKGTPRFREFMREQGWVCRVAKKRKTKK